MRRKIRIARALLIICLIALVPGFLGNQTDSRSAEEAIYSSMRELIRIPLSPVPPDSTVRFRAWIPESFIGENSVGHRFFQVSVKEKANNSHSVLPWNSGLIKVSVKQDGKELPLRVTKTPFYLEGYATDTPLGLAFDPESRKECDFELTFSSRNFNDNSELVIAPNWPNPMFIKDQIVGAMVTPAFNRILTWVNRIAFGFSLVALGLLFLIPTKGLP